MACRWTTCVPPFRPRRPTRRRARRRVRALLPQLKASTPEAIDLPIVSDRTPTLRASVVEVERALVIAVALVILVVFLFLRNGRATLIPAVAVPVSLAGTFGVMYLAALTLGNHVLLALPLATRFLVAVNIPVHV